MSTLVTVSVLVGGALNIVGERRLLKREMNAQQQETMKRLARVCEESLYQKNLSFFNYLPTLESERGFKAAFFEDSTGIIQMHSDPEQMGKKIPAVNSDLLDLSEPITYAGTRVGNAHLILSKTEVDKLFMESLMDAVQRTIITMLASLLLGWFGALFLGSTMITPIQRLIDGFRKVATGALEPIAFPERHDELGQTFKELNVTIEKLKEMEDMKRNFFAQVTHELRSPLTTNQGFLSLILRGRYGTLNDEQRGLFLTMHNNLDRLARLVDDLLTTSKLESKKETLEPTQFDAKKVVQEVIEMYVPLFEQKKLKLATNFPNEAVMIRADYDKLIHILSNLISNAIKYTPKGSVSIGIKEQGANVAIWVTDTGLGIPASDQPQIFNHFFRSSNAKNVKGTGLGLAIVKNLVEMHGGQIRVDENPGGGSIFSFSLPKKIGMKKAA